MSPDFGPKLPQNSAKKKSPHISKRSSVLMWDDLWCYCAQGHADVVVKHAVELVEKDCSSLFHRACDPSSSTVLKFLK